MSRYAKLWACSAVVLAVIWVFVSLTFSLAAQNPPDLQAALKDRHVDWLQRELKYKQHEIDVITKCNCETSPPKTRWCARELEKVDTDKRGMRYEAESLGFLDDDYDIVHWEPLPRVAKP